MTDLHPTIPLALVAAAMLARRCRLPWTDFASSFAAAAQHTRQEWLHVIHRLIRLYSTAAAYVRVPPPADLPFPPDYESAIAHSAEEGPPFGANWVLRSVTRQVEEYVVRESRVTLPWVALRCAFPVEAWVGLG